MNNMPLKLRRDCASDIFYTRCARQDALHDHVCAASPLTGKLIEWEHAIIFANNQVQQKFALVPLCWWAHSGPGLKKQINVWIALNRATDEEIVSISRAVDYFRVRALLNKQFGEYMPVQESPAAYSGINYGFV